MKREFYLPAKFNQLQKLAGRMNRLIETDHFRRFSMEKQTTQLRRLKRLYCQLIGKVPQVKLQYVMGAALALVLSLGSLESEAQSFAPPDTNAFGILPIQQYACPTFVDIDDDGDFDIFAGQQFGGIQYYENTGTSTAPAFAAPILSPFGLAAVNGWWAYPTLADMDNDGDFDIFIGGHANSQIIYYENTGTVTVPAFTNPQIGPFGLTGVQGAAFPRAADLDNDGDYDLMACEYFGNFIYFENTGTVSAPAFAAQQVNPFNLSSSGFDVSFPALVDIDMDSDLDLFIGGPVNGGVDYYRNSGSVTAPSFSTQQGNPFNLSNVDTMAYPSFVDIDADGDQDAFFGEVGGNIIYMENIEITTGMLKTSNDQLKVYPNPSSDGQFIIEALAGETWSVTNIVGETVLSGMIRTNHFTLKLSAFPAGIYFLCIGKDVKKLVLK